MTESPEPSPPATAGASATAIQILSVDEGATTRINEFWVEFTLTPAQVEHEAAEEEAMAQGQSASTGVTLATRAANILAQAEDTLIFQGKSALDSPLFTGAGAAVNYRKNNVIDLGLLNIQLDGPPQSQPLTSTIVMVHPVPGQAGAYQGLTVSAVAQAYSQLQANGQYGPFALVLETVPFADAHSPLPNTLILPAASIKELVTAGFFGTATLPPWTIGGASLPPPDGFYNGLPPLPPPPPKSTKPKPAPNPATAVLYTGVLVSIGGNTVDLVRGALHPEHDAVVAFEQKDTDGNYRFRVVERFALRLKDPRAVALLEFVDA